MLFCSLSPCLVAFDAVVDRCLNTITAGAVQVSGLHASVAPRRQQEQTPPTLEKFCFVPHIEGDCLSSDAQLLSSFENCKGNENSISLEFISENDTPCIKLALGPQSERIMSFF